MSFSAYVNLHEAGNFAKAYERVISVGAVSGETGFNLSYEETTPIGVDGQWLVQIKAENYRVFMELMAHLHLEMPEEVVPVVPSGESEDGIDDAEFSDGSVENNPNENAPEFQDGKSESEDEEEESDDDEEYEDDDTEDEDDNEEGDEGDDEEEEEEKPEAQNDERRLKLKRPNNVTPTENKNISFVG